MRLAALATGLLLVVLTACQTPEAVPVLPDPVDATPEPESATVAVYFTNRGLGPVGQVYPVARTTLDDDLPRIALEALVAGPTASERALGYTSWFSSETAGMVSSLRIGAGVAHVDFDPALADVPPDAFRSGQALAVLNALDATLTQVEHVMVARYTLGGDAVAFLDWIHGPVVEEIVPGEEEGDEEAPEPPDEREEEPAPAPDEPPDRGDDAVREAQQLLNDLGYPAGAVDGLDGAHTRRGLCAWRRLDGREATRAELQPDELEALRAATGLPDAPEGRGVLVDKTCQAVYYRADGQWQAVLIASTGRSGLPNRGEYRIQHKRAGWHTSSLYPAPQPNMYNTMYFSGVIAIHGSHEVPAYPASAGCVRVTPAGADYLFPRLEIGDPVTVVGGY